MANKNEIEFMKAIKQESAAQSALAQALDKAIEAFGASRLAATLVKEPVQG